VCVKKFTQRFTHTSATHWPKRRRRWEPSANIARGTGPTYASSAGARPSFAGRKPKPRLGSGEWRRAAYKRTYSKRKKTSKRDELRCDPLTIQLGPERKLSALNNDRLTQWRDDRLTTVSDGTVRSDWNLLNHVLNVATKEWGWIPFNPLTQVKRPPRPDERTPVWTKHDVDTYLHCCGHPGKTLTARTGWALLFALETAMREGEICAITPALDRGTQVHLPKQATKNGHARNVPLTARAREILDEVGADFGLRADQLRSLSSKVIRRTGAKNLRFHDSRRTALTRLCKRVDALELAMISGHRDLKILLDTYYAPDVVDLHAKINRGQEEAA